jgi:multimeric flavodoxin WrbA
VHGGILLKKLVTILFIILLCTANVYAKEEAPSYSIQINVATRTLRLFESGSLIKEYPVAVGKIATKTPLGIFEIKNKAINPYWNNKGKGVAPGPRNPLGIRWMGISIPKGTYGIHGNNVASSIGTFASGGCIRMYNNDVEELYSKVGLKTTVEIIYENIEMKQDRYTDTPVLIVYPDVYKKKGAESLLKKLTASNKNITPEQASRALKLTGKSISNPVAVSSSTAVLLNNQFVTNDAFIEGSEVYLYYLAALEIFGIDNSIVTDLSIPVLEKDNKVYVNLTQIASKSGGQLKVDKINNNVYLNNNIIKINGKYLSYYTGSFDKENLIKSSLIGQLGNYAADKSKEFVNLKELCKQHNWKLKADSLSKIMDIEVPLRVKVGETYISTAFYNGRYYICSEDAVNIPEIQSQKLNTYSYKDKNYYDVTEIMERYECQKDYFSTTVEVLKLVNSEV